VNENRAQLYRRYNPNVTIIDLYPEIRLAGSMNPVFNSPHLTMIYAGRLSEDRCMLLYIDVLRTLRAMGIPARMIYVGVFTPPEGEQTLREYVDDFQDCIDIRGWIPYSQIPETLRAADLGLVILTRQKRHVEVIQTKIFEYMACGLPFIASEFPLIEAVVNEFNCGILVDPSSDTDAIAKRIKTLWDNPQQAQILGENGRLAILKKYNWESLETELLNLYRSLLPDG